MGDTNAIEVESLAQLDELLHAAGSRPSLDGWRVQGLDLRERTAALSRADGRGAVFLGCDLQPAAETRLRASGAVIFPPLPDLPFKPYRPALYDAAELYAGLDQGYASTADALTYQWSQSDNPDVARLFAQAMHDASIDDALDALVGELRMVGVMGGHAVERGSGDYRAAAELGRRLAREGLTVTTGGGPGAMEAANLGAYLADADDDALEAAIAMLARVPSFSPSIDDWAAAAFEVLQRWPQGIASVGIPTWFYGHEPSNVFASHIAKYFKNAVREDVLLQSCVAGIVFLPGAAGTVQEIFQDACENYYARQGEVAPMVLVGREHWTTALPAWPLLEALGRERPMGRAVHLVDTPADVVDALTNAARSQDR